MKQSQKTSQKQTVEEQEPDAGVYALALRMPAAKEICFGGRIRRLSAGYYVYIGRAIPGLRARLQRHLRDGKKLHWHIDRLRVHAQVRDIQATFTRDPGAECRYADAVAAWPGAEAVPGFGASDCRCRTHLYFFPEPPGIGIRAAEFPPVLPVMFSELAQRYDNHADKDRDPFHSLVSCLLSLRTKDAVTDAASQRLLARFNTPAAFADADPQIIADIIYPVGMYRDKSRRLVNLGRILQDQYNGRVPAELDELTALPGVGRKTATLVRSFAFHLPAVCVDTHVHRITNRWGLVRSRTPEQTEQALMATMPQRYWNTVNPFLVQHGQQRCKPRKPDCTRCCLQPYCLYSEVLETQRLIDTIPASPGHPSLVLA